MVVIAYVVEDTVFSWKFVVSVSRLLYISVVIDLVNVELVRRSYVITRGGEVYIRSCWVVAWEISLLFLFLFHAMFCILA